MKFFILIVLFTTCLFSQTTYYISPTGSDAANGTTQETPWATPQKINDGTYVSDDSILFKRGGEWSYGEIAKTLNGTDGHRIVIGAYGTGALPILYGEPIYATWWATDVDSIWGTMFGYAASGRGFQDSLGTWRILSKISATEFDSTTLFTNLHKSSWGFRDNRVWVKTWNGEAPTSSTIRLFHEANFVRGSYLTIENIDFRNWETPIKCINYGYVDSMMIKNCDFNNNIWMSIFLTAQNSGQYRNCVIEYNDIDSCGYTAIYDQFGRGNRIRNNNISNVVLTILGIPLYTFYTPEGNAIWSENAGVGVERDTNCVIENNVFTNCTAGGIDTYLNVDDTVRNNTITCQSGIFLHGTRWTAFSNNITANGTCGIKADLFGTGETKIYDNTIALSSYASGIVVQSSASTGTVVSYGNSITATSNILALSDFKIAGVTSTNNDFFGYGRFYYQEDAYYTLAAFKLATGFESGSTFNGEGGNDPIIISSALSYAFGNIIDADSSDEWSYVIEGDYLTPESDNITVTAPTGYKVRTSETGFASSVVISYTGSTLASTTIYVKFYPTLVQLYSGNITNVGGGATTKNVALTGTGIAASMTISSTSGNSQGQFAATILRNPFIVTLLNGVTPIQNVLVEWSITSYPENATGMLLSSYGGLTNASGQVTSRFTIGDKVGTYIVTATAPEIGSITFTILGTGLKSQTKKFLCK